jgi:hypothetical protein
MREIDMTKVEQFTTGHAVRYLRRAIFATSVRTHATAGLLGMLAVFALQGQAQTDAETMLGNLSLDDLRGLRSYLEVKAGDLQQYQIRMQDRLEKLESQVAAMDNKVRNSNVVRAPFTVMDRNGTTAIFRVDKSPELGFPLAVVGYENGARVDIGINANGSQIIMSTDTNEQNIIFDASYDASYMEVRDKAHRSIVGTDERGSASGIFVRRPGEEKIAASMTLDRKGGGIVKAFNFHGDPVAALFSDASGGRVIVANASNGKTMASVGGNAAGGVVNVFPTVGGHARASLDIDGVGGAVNLFNTEGTEVRARLTSDGEIGSGLLQLGNGNGDIVVNAGTTAGQGVGFVSTGPFDAGVAGVLGDGFSAASSLLGKATQKK